jgi:Recombination endonuclease VII
MGRGPKRVTEPGKKWCPGCKTAVDISLFTFSNKAKGKLTSYCKVHDAERRKKYYTAHTEQMINRMYRYNYGTEADIYDRLFEEQRGRCACCGSTETRQYQAKTRRLALDHCHNTGRVRGLLCRKCNLALGYLDEDPEKIRLLLKYVEERCLL